MAPLKIEGDLVAVADIFGDWREVIITTLPGEMRIYYSGQNIGYTWGEKKGADHVG